jgi:hypothetical protein
MALVKGRSGSLSYDLDGGSTAQIYTVALSASTVSTVANTIRLGSHQLYTGQPVTIAGGTLPSGLTAGNYFVILVPGDTSVVRLASTRANAYAGTAVALTATGSATMTVTTSDVTTMSTLVKEWSFDYTYGKADATVLGATVKREVKTIANGSGTLMVLFDDAINELLRASAAPNNDGQVQLVLWLNAPGGQGFQFNATLFGFKTSSKVEEVTMYEIEFTTFSEVTFLGA